MAKATYEQAYATLKSAGWDDDKIKTNLAKKGLYPDKGGGGADLGGPDNNSPINDIEVPDTYNNVDVDYTDPKGEEKFGEVDAESSKPETDSSEVVSGGMSPTDAARITMIIQEAIKNGVTIKGLSNWLGKFASGAGKALGITGKFLARNAGAIATGLASAYEAEQDRKNGTLKASYGVDGDYSAGAYAKDFGRNLYAYTDNVAFGLLPNIDSVYNKGEDDGWYGSIHANDAQKHQKEELQKNKEIVDDYKKLGGNRFDNLLGTDWFEGGYLEEEKNIKKKYGGDGVSMAEQQLTRAAVDLGLQNDADFKKQIIDDGYKFGMVKDKNGNTTKTWYKKTTGSDGKTKYVTLTNEVKNIRSKAGKESKTNEKKK